TGVRNAAAQVAELIRNHPNARLVNYNWNELAKSVRIDIDQDKARLTGLTSEQIATAVNTALSGRVATQVRDDTYPVEVRSRAQGSERGDLQSLRDLEITTSNGKTVPLAQVATINYGLEESLIWRRDRLPTITVQADITNDVQAATVMGELAAPIAALA